MQMSGVPWEALQPSVRGLPQVLRQFGVRGWLVAAAAGATSALVIGIPTVLIANGWYIRMTPPRPQDYVVWVLSALLIGLIAGTFVAAKNGTAAVTPAATGGLLSYLAVGCPICNKVAVALLGVSGALNLFGPAQLFIGIASVILLGFTLLLRVKAISLAACPLPSAA